MFAYFTRIKPLKDKILPLRNSRNSFLSSVALMLLIKGKFLSSYFLGIQVLAIRCYYIKGLCVSQTQITRLATNIIGCFMTMLITIIQFRIQKQNLPVSYQPWAARQTGFHILYRLNVLLGVLLLVFEDDLAASVDYFVIFLPLIAITSILLWACLFSTLYYSDLIEKVRLVILLMYWNFSVFALLLRIVIQQSDFSFAILLGITTVIMVLAAYLYKHQSLYKEIDMTKIKTEGQAVDTLFTVFRLITKSKDPNADMAVEHIYRAHKLTCGKAECICKAHLQEDGGVEANQADDYNEIKRKKRIRLLNKEGDKKHDRNIMVLELIFQHLDNQFNSTFLKFFQLYIDISSQEKIYSSLYFLMEIKKNFQSKDIQTFKFLKALILNSVQDRKKLNSSDMIDVDQMLNLDKRFSEYKKLVFETSVVIDRFWSQLSKNDYQINHLIEFGTEVVDSYLKTKQAFEYIIEQKADHEEAVSIHIKFNELVMNFEIEASIYQNMLSNIRQKLQISKQSHYLQQKDQQSIILISGNPQTFNRILLANRRFAQVLGYSHEELRGKSMHMLMPQIISQVHDRMVSSFLTEAQKPGQGDSVTKRVWFLKNDQTILPAMLNVQVRVSQTQDLVLVGILDDTPEIQIAASNFRLSKTYTILTDDQEVIREASANVLEKFISDDFFSFEDTRVMIQDLFMNLQNFTDDALKEGVRTFLVDSTIGKSQTMNIQESTSIIEVYLKKQSYNLPSQVRVDEYLFMPVFQNQMRPEQTNVQKQTEQQLEAIEQLNDQEFIGPINSQSGSASGSSLSGSKTSLISLTMRLKQQIDEKETPQSLRNLKKAIILFFFLLIGTAFAVLALNQVQNTEFLSDSDIVKHSVEVGGHLAYLRLSFRMMLIIGKVTIGNSENYNVDNLERYMTSYLSQLQQDVNKVLTQSNYIDSAVRLAVTGNNVEVFQLQGDGSISTTNYSLPVSLQQYIATAQKYTSISMRQLNNYFDSFSIRALPSSPSYEQRDAYFLIINGMYGIYDNTVNLSQLFIAQYTSKINSYGQVVLIITIICLLITFLSTCIMMPIIFAVDNEFAKIVEQWLLISKKDLRKILGCIDQFVKMRTIDEKQNSKRTRRTTHSIQDVGAHLLNNESLEMRMDESLKSFNLDKTQMPLQKEKTLQNSIGQGVYSRSFMNFDSVNSGMRAIIESGYHEGIFETSKNVQRSQLKLSMESHSQIQSPQKSSCEEIKTISLEEEYQVNEIQTQKLYQLYRWKKFKKAALILTFSFLVFAFYITFYEISNQMYTDAIQSFQYLQLFSTRPRCLADSFEFMIETIEQNQTIMINQGFVDSFNYTLNTCMNYEVQLRDYVQTRPPQLLTTLDLIDQLDADQMCPIVFDGNQTKIQNCQTTSNGILLQGLQDAQMKQYFYIISQYVEFYAYNKTPWLRTNAYLQNLEYQNSLQNQVFLILSYLIPAQIFLQDFVVSAVQNYQKQYVSIFIAVFSVFLIFLLVSLAVTLKIAINYLRTMVIRSRLLVKIIPSEALMKVMKAMKKKAKAKKTGIKQQH